MSVNIYKLSCSVTGLNYYGSTKQTLHRRLQKHESDYRCYIKGTYKRFTTSYDILKNNDYKIELMEHCEEENRNERESYYIRNFECVNKITIGRTTQEYGKEWHERNKERRNQQSKERYYSSKTNLKITIA